MWTPREFQTIGAAAQNVLAANDIVAGFCSRRRAEVERRVLDGCGVEFHTVGTPADQTDVPYT